MLTRAAVIFVILILAATVIARAERTEIVPARQPLSTLPMDLGEWRGQTSPPLSKEVLEVLGADDVLTRTYYTSGGRAAGLYIGYWASQKRGDTVHSPQNCLPGSGWEPVSNRLFRFTVPTDVGSREIEVNRYIIQKGLDRQLVLYWYQSHGRVIASEYWGKFYLVADSMRLGRSDTAIVRVVTPIIGQSPEAEAAAEASATRFVEQLFPQLSDYVPS